MKQQKQELIILHTNHGFFYRAFLNEARLTQAEVLTIMGSPEINAFQMFRSIVAEFEKTTEKYNVDVWEKDID